MDNQICKYEGCDRPARYALYRLYPDFTKKWVNVCSVHDKIVAHNSKELKDEYPEVKFREVKE